MQDIDQNFASWAARAGGQGESTVEISLDAELLNTLYRRSRRRLRDIQANCQVLLKLDRARSSLRVSGPEESIRAVRRHLENLTGPCKQLPPAVWAELMRTRTLCHSSRATVARVQNLSGCRIHIERGKQEVRLFGPQDGIAMAERLLDEFAATCGEEVVDVESPTTSLSSTTLQSLAHAFSVTLRVEDHQVAVLGIKSSVADACQELRKYVLDPEGYSTDSLPEAPDSETEEHTAMEAEQQPRAPSKSTGASGGSVTAAAAPPTRSMGVVTKAKPISEQAVGQRGDVQRGTTTATQGQDSRCCPGCGSHRFCSGCGMEIWQVNVVNFAPAAQGMVPAGALMQPGYEAGYSAMMGEQREGFNGQDWRMQQVWGPVEQPQMMYCMNPKAAGNNKVPAQGMVPMQFPAMQALPGSSSTTGGPPAQQGQQVGLMQAYMVPANMVPAWCGL